MLGLCDDFSGQTCQLERGPLLNHVQVSLRFGQVSLRSGHAALLLVELFHHKTPSFSFFVYKIKYICFIYTYCVRVSHLSTSKNSPTTRLSLINPAGNFVVMRTSILLKRLSLLARTNFMQTVNSKFYIRLYVFYPTISQASVPHLARSLLLRSFLPCRQSSPLARSRYVYCNYAGYY
jgi:hypothetical protein